MNELYKELKKYGRVRLNEPMRKHTTIQVGGPAEYLVSVNDNDKLVGLLSYLSGEGVPFFILGGGSNVLMSDNGFEGVVISVETNKLDCQGGKIVCDSGASFSSLVSAAAANSLTGMEWAAGIPGTVGGAVRGNAGAMGSDTSQSIEDVYIWKDGEIISLQRNECDFGYRNSIFKKDGGVILRIIFKFSPGDAKEILRLTSDNIAGRHGRHPALPSAGSFFKNIKLANWPGEPGLLPAQYRERGTIPAGYLIEELGLKGFQIGGAGVSQEHGNFIVNYGGATQADIIAVVEAVKEKVYNRYGVELVPEVEIVK
ncbi:MAG: UDP-N-acetylmuramate dehydrogenase [Candidatus Magasanikbacteria bacterium]|nr:UDP-N-acetylmuramate dehydrogenase [Candidatus Magasanikbacteria bacterium]